MEGKTNRRRCAKGEETTRGSMVSSVGVVAEVRAGSGFRRAEGNSMAMMEERVHEGGYKGVSNERDEGGGASFCTPGGVPWHGRTQTRGARSLLPWNILSNELGTVGGSELLYVSRFSQFRNVPRSLEDLEAEMGSSSHRRGFRDRVIGEKHGTCRECSRTMGGGVCM